MKTITMKTLATSIVAAALLFTGCKKGDTGPAGASGANGNANVQVTEITIQPSDWGAVIPNYQYTKSFSVPAITQSVIDKGTVELQGASGSITDPNISFSYSIGQVQVLDNTNNSAPSTTDYFKIVVIAGQ